MSPRASRDAKAGRRSWRYAKSSSEAAGSKKPYLIFLTLLLLVSLGLLWWLLWPTRDRNAHLAIIEVPANRRIFTTPFAHNDFQRLNSLDEKVLREPEDWDDIRDNSDFADQVGPKVQGMLNNASDKLILYINTPGISDAGTAYLTHSDYLTSDAAFDGRHPVFELLETIAGAGEGLKLIVLDSTSVDVDPRLGLVVNEFVRLLEADVKKLDKDSNLFVLLPCGPFQVSTTSYGDRQSLFGKYLADGLEGASDRQGVGDGNRFVTLYELYEYVRRECETFFDSKVGVQQTPVLLQAGIGYVPPSTDLNTERFNLTQVTKKKEPPAQPPQKADEENGDPAEEKQTDKAVSRLWPVGRASNLAWMQAAAGNKQAPTDSTAEPKEEPTAAKEEPAAGTAKEPSENKDSGVSPEPPPAEKTERATPAELTPQEQLLLKLDKAWRLRDAIQTHDVTPATFAPHLWRALEAELLFVERQVLADPVFDPPKAEIQEGEAEPVLPLAKNVTEMEDLIRTFTSLDAAISSKRQSRPPTDDRSLLARLLRAWDQFLATQLDDEENFSLREAPKVVQLRNQARESDLLVYSLPYYIRWHARAHQSLASDSVQHQRLDDYLEQTVRLATTLGSLRALPQLGYSDQYRLDQVSTQLRDASESRQKLDDALWEGDDLGNPIIMERLLATPLLDTGRRMQLLRALVEIAPGKPGDRVVPDARRDLSVSAKNWQRLLAHCELELRLVELALGADHDRVKLLRGELAKAGELARAEGSEAELWETYRRVGEQFGFCLESLPKSILSNAAGDYAMHIVDDRDVADPGNSALDTRPALQLHLKYEPELKVEIAEEQQRAEFDLKLNESRQLVLTIRATREKDASEPLETQVESALLEVTCKPTGPPEKKFGWYEQTVVCDVRAREGVTQLPGRKTTSVKFSSSASEQLNQKLNLTFTLPRPDQVSLEVLRLSKRSQNVQRELDGSLTLGLLPSNVPEPAVTEFQFRARNESGKPRKLRAELYVVKPGRVGQQKKHGTISKERREELYREQANSLDLAQLELVAEVNDVDVEVDESAVIAFKAPASATATPPAAGAPEKPNPPPTLKDANHGMVCVLRDETGKPWVKWIETEPIPLTRYLNADCWYESGRVVVEVTGKPHLDNDFPANGLTLTWDTKPDFPDGTKRRIDATIVTPGNEPKKTLYVDVQPDGIEREVYIGVNGCPRVLSFRVSCRESPDRIEGVKTWIERRSIAVTKLSIPGTSQVFHIPTRPIRGRESIYLDGPPPGAKPVEGEVFLEQKQPVIVAMPVDKLRVHFHLDVPVEGLDPGRGDAIELLVDDERLGIANGDRHLRTSLMDLGDNGVVRLGMQMEEQFIDIEPRDRDEALTLIAKLTVDRRQPEWSQPIPVIFDGTRPVIREVNVPAQLDVESKQVVEVEVEELSGISEARYWFSVSPAQVVEKPLTAALLGPPVRQGKMLRLRFNVDTAGIDEGKYFLSIQVDDRVKLTSGTSRSQIEIKKKVVVPVVATIWGNVGITDYLFTTVQLLTKAGEEIPAFPPQVMVMRYEFKQLAAGEYIVRATLKRDQTEKKVDKPVTVNKSGQLRVDFSFK